MDTQKTHKIQEVTIKNFKGIDFQHFSPMGKNVYLIGPNQAGKTSIIDAILLNIPELPLKNGEHKGEIAIDLGAYQIEYKFSEKNQKGKLSIFSAEDGAEVKAPATLLKQLFGVKDFKIDEFLQLSDAKQLEKIKEIAGVDFSALDKEFAGLYDNRRILARELKEIEAQTLMLKFDSVVGTERKDPNTLQAKIKEAIEHNSELQAVRDRQMNRLAVIEQKKKALAELQQYLQEAELQATQAQVYIDTEKEIDTDGIEEELRNVYSFNELVEANFRAKAIREKEKNWLQEISETEKRMQQIKDEKVKMIEAANLPVKGLTIDDAGLYLDGLPFRSNQINTARRIIAGLEIQLAMMGEVRVAAFDGSLLDNKSMAEVIKWAAEKDVELFIEEVAKSSDKLEIKITEA